MQGYGFFYGAPSNRKLATPFRQWDDLKLPDNVCRSQDCHCHPRRSTAGDSCHCVSSAPCEMQHLQPLGNSICSVPLLRWGLRGRHLWIFLVIVWQWPEVVERRIASSGGINKLIKWKEICVFLIGGTYIVFGRVVFARCGKVVHAGHGTSE